MNSLAVRALRSTLIGAVVMALLLFVPAGTWRYWQGWLFMAVFEICSTAIGLYLAVYDPALLERRMTIGPRAEKEPAQKIIVSLALLGSAAIVVLSALDYRFGWSHVPAFVSVIGNIAIVISFILFIFVFRANSYGAATIKVEQRQTVSSTGPYAFVRHPMYSGALVMMAGVPPALGSWWGLVAVLGLIPILVWRILDEERVLTSDLPGYADYAQRVRYRLVPRVW